MTSHSAVFDITMYVATSLGRIKSRCRYLAGLRVAKHCLMLRTTSNRAVGLFVNASRREIVISFDLEYYFEIIRQLDDHALQIDVSGTCATCSNLVSKKSIISISTAISIYLFWSFDNL